MLSAKCLALLTLMFFAPLAYAGNSSCLNSERSGSFLRELLESAADFPISNDRGKLCYEVARSAGKISAASSYLSQYYDIQWKTPIAMGLSGCKSKIETAKAACGDFSAGIDPQVRLRLESLSFVKLKGIVKEFSDCLKQAAYSSLPQGSIKESSTAPAR